MQLDALIATARDAITVQRVFGEPYEKDGVTVIPAASVAGGGGGGGGRDGDQEGQGGGFGMAGRPAGAYVLRDGTLRWQPAVDVNRLVSTVGVVAVAFLLTRARVQAVRLRAGR